MVVGKLRQDGRLELSGGLSTTEPIVSDGLKVNLPFDDRNTGEANFNLIDYSTWKIGTSGSQVGFNQNGDGNSIIESLDPFGDIVPIWQTLGNDTSSDADGGFNTANIGIDSTKLYRFSVWVNRKVLGDGKFYFGTRGFGTTNGVYNNNSSNGDLDLNPYFYTNSNLPDTDKWFLVVGHIHPHNTTEFGLHVDSGIYEAMSTAKITDLNIKDFRWHSSTANSLHRSYLFYSTKPETRQLWAYPRIDLCDGTEPSIKDLVYGEGNVLNPRSMKVRYIRDWVNGSTSNSSNHWVEIEALNSNGVNLALNKTSDSDILVDGDKNTNHYFTKGTDLKSVQVDLGKSYYIDKVIVYHYYNDNRTYHNTKTEVSEDGNTWFTIFDSYYEGEYPEPLDGTGKTHYVGPKYIRNVNDGLGIYKNTINYLNYSDNKATLESSWNGEANLVYNYSLNKKVFRWDSSTGNYVYTNNNVLSNFLATLSDKTVTFSLMLRRLEGTSNSRIRIYDSVTGYTYKTLIVDDDFQKVEIVKTIGSNPDRIFVMLDNTGGGTFEFYDAQLEISSASSLYIEKNIGKSHQEYQFPLLQECTIMGEFVPRFSFKNEEGYTKNENQSALLGLHDDKNNGNIYYRYYNPDGVSEPFLDPDGYFGTSHIHAENEYIKNIKLYYVIIKSGTEISLQIYQDGWKNKHTLTGVPVDSIFNRISFGSTTLWEGVHSNLKIYDRKLSNEEINKLIKGTHSFNSVKLITSKVRTLHKHPDNSKYFPLDGDGSDITKSILPIKNNNTHFNNEVTGVFINSGTVNQFVESVMVNNLYQGTTIPISNDSPLNGKHNVYRVAGLARFGNSDGTDVGTLYKNKTYTFSIYLRKVSETLPDMEFDIVDKDGVRNFEGNLATNLTYEWQRFSTTVTHDRNENYHFIDIGANNDDSCVWEWSCPQIEERSFLTPFISNSIGSTSLHLPYDIIDLKTDFTIYGWWFPMVYADNVYRNCISRNVPDGNSTYNRVLIMASAKTGRRLSSWESSDGSTEGRTYGPSDILVKDKKWNFFCYRRQGNVLKLTLGNSNGIGHGSSNNGSKLDNDESGQVWHVGQFGGNRSDAYHRDYVFLQRYLTDNEIETIFKTKMKSDKNGILLQNNFNTNRL